MTSNSVLIQKCLSCALLSATRLCFCHAIQEVTELHYSRYGYVLNTVFCQINKWFKDNLISLNLNKTYFIQFSNKSIGNSNIQIMTEDKQISAVNGTKFLRLIIDNTLSWKGHIEYIKSKLSSAC